MSRMRWRQALAPGTYVLLAAIGIVFCHSAINGERGLTALAEAEALRTALEVELAGAEAERAEIANKVERLAGPVIDPDLLDERARDVLGVGRPEDVLIRP
ncbi:MAG: septum formation initiator family protein [Pseudomonadota bacterium]